MASAPEAPAPVPKPEVPSLRDQIMKACLEDGRGTSLAIYGTLDIRGTWAQIRNTACHAGLLSDAYVCKKHAAYLLGMTPQARLKKGHREADIAYYAWLLGPESPYRSVVKDFNPDPEFALDYGIVVGDLDTAPVNVLYHFFIASRLIYENHLGPIWHGFVKEGLHPVMAFLATYTVAMSGYGPSHCAFPLGGVKEQWLVNFANAAPVRLDGPWRKTHRHDGADNTWGSLPEMCRRTYTPGPDCWCEWEKNHDAELWAKKPVYDYDPRFGFGADPVGPRTPSRYQVTPKDRASGIQILLAEQERLLGC